MSQVISVQDLVKDYGDLRAVDHLSFEVNGGEIFALLGPNGAGKTTTCEILETLRNRTSGAVEVLGMDPARKGEQVRTRIGVLPQSFNTFETLTCRENMRYFAAMFHARPDVDELLARVGLEDRSGTKYGELSGGLKQRLGIAISLVNDPEIVFLDEPTTGLDPRARRDTWQVIRDLASRGRTVFLTTHYMDEAQLLADRVAVMSHGRLVAIDEPRRLVRKHAPWQEVRLVGGAAVTLDNRYPTEVTGADRIVRAPDLSALEEVLADARAQGGTEAVEVRSATLEDVFLQLTGERLEAEE